MLDEGIAQSSVRGSAGRFWCDADRDRPEVTDRLEKARLIGDFWKMPSFKEPVLQHGTGCVLKNERSAKMEDIERAVRASGELMTD